MGGTGTDGVPIAGTVTLVVEDGTGLNTANSYASLAEADAYIESKLGSSAWGTWSTKSESDRIVALIQATQYLDAQYDGQWRGSRANETQALAWPRASVEDDDGYAVDDDVVPQKLKDACCEMAYRSAAGDSLLGVVTQPGSVTQESKTIGPITVAKTYAGGKPHGYLYPKIPLILKSLISVGGRLFRG